MGPTGSGRGWAPCVLRRGGVCAPGCRNGGRDVLRGPRTGARCGGADGIGNCRYRRDRCLRGSVAAARRAPGGGGTQPAARRRRRRQRHVPRHRGRRHRRHRPRRLWRRPLRRRRRRPRAAVCARRRPAAVPRRRRRLQRRRRGWRRGATRAELVARVRPHCVGVVTAGVRRDRRRGWRRRRRGNAGGRAAHAGAARPPSARGEAPRARRRLGGRTGSRAAHRAAGDGAHCTASARRLVGGGSCRSRCDASPWPTRRRRRRQSWP
mmetsp:Transcript_19265/g.68059  ORF Transcript_19265/g.68059 Transcript_19265/m.68059 type:complete len:265 (+) Transcript_19265:556-1350(+)